MKFYFTSGYEFTLKFTLLKFIAYTFNFLIFFYRAVNYIKRMGNIYNWMYDLSRI